MDTSRHIFLVVCSILSIIPAPSLGGTQQALVFSIKSPIIYGTWPIDQSSESYFINYAVACAASDHVQEAFMAKKSYELKSLFVDNIYYQANIQKETFQSRICDKPFQISAAFYWSDRTIQFGYEVYYDREKFTGFQSPAYKDFASMSHSLSSWDEKKQKFSFESLKLFHGPGEETKLGFVWVNRVIVNYDLDHWLPRITKYLATRIADTTLRQCNNYDLGAGYYKDINIDTFYTEDNQKEIFQKLETSSIFTNIGCASNCLSKYQLIPANHLSLDSATPRTCSNITTIPIWTNLTKPPLDVLTILIQAIIRVLNRNLYLFIGAEQPFALKSARLISRHISHTVYLHKRDNKIPIPTVLYYLISYTSPSCKFMQICEYAIIVVVQNDPNYASQDRICPEEEDTCQALGWDVIQHQKAKFDNVYCCKATKDTIPKIGVSQPELYKFKELNLRDLPVERNGIVQNENIKESVMDEMKLVLDEARQLLNKSRSRL